MSRIQPEMSQQEIAEFCREWQAHLALLEGKVNPEYLLIARCAVTPENFGREQGQLSPIRENSPFDLYFLLVPAPGVPDALLICRLQAEQVQEALDQEDPSRVEIDISTVEGRLFKLQLELLELGYPPR